MQISVENATPDFSRQVNNIPPINTQRANTQVLVSDGQTTVIGGIYVSNSTLSSDKTPGLGNVPLLKWLFKRDSRRRVEHRAADLHHAAHHQELTAEDAMRTSIRLFGLAALTAATVSCGDVVRQGSSPVFLVIDQLAGQRGATTLGAPSNPLDLRRDHQRHVAGAVLGRRRRARRSSATAARSRCARRSRTSAPRWRSRRPRTTRSRSTAYHVEYIARRRPQHARASTCRSRSTARSPARSRRAARCTLGFELVRNVAKQESPLVQLAHQQQLHHGDRRRDVLRRRPRRQRRSRPPGQIQIEFGNFGDQ